MITKSYRRSLPCSPVTGCTYLLYADQLQCCHLQMSSVTVLLLVVQNDALVLLLLRNV